MKNLGRKLLLPMIAILTLASVGYSQSSAGSSDNRTGQLTNSERAELVTRCEAAADEIAVSRKLIAGYKGEIAAKEEALQRSLQKGDLDEKEIALERAEIDKLRSALAAETAAYEDSKKALAVYKGELARMTKKKNFFKAMTKIFAVTTLAAASAAAVLLVKP